MEEDIQMTKPEFTRLYSDVEIYLFRFAKKLTKSEFEAKDLVQETVLRAYNKKDSFRKSTSFKSWISTIMFHSFVSAYRKEKRQMNYRREINDLLVIPVSTAHSNDGYHSLIQEDITVQLDVLSPKMRATFELHIQGYRYAEISDILEIPSGTVKSRINYARVQLRKCLDLA